MAALIDKTLQADAHYYPIEDLVGMLIGKGAKVGIMSGWIEKDDQELAQRLGIPLYDKPINLDEIEKEFRSDRPSLSPERRWY